MKLVVSKCTKELSGLKVCWLTMRALNIQDWLWKNSVMESCPLISPVLGLTALIITGYMYIINMMCFGALKKINHISWKSASTGTLFGTQGEK